MIKKICGALMLTGLISHAVADVSSIKNTCLLNAESPATVKILDDCWQNRETTANQDIITKYLEVNPPVASNYDIAWRVARFVSFIGSCGYEAKSYKDSDRGIKLFSYGVKASEIAMNLKNNQVEGAFWYAVDLGSYDSAKGGMAGFSDRKKWLNAATLANSIDSSYYYYGSNRMLAVYYVVLPKMFGGDNDKALAYLTDATTKAPQFKDNWVTLGAYYLTIKNYQKALENCKKALAMPGIDGKYEEMKYNKDATECINTANKKLN